MSIDKDKIEELLEKHGAKVDYDSLARKHGGKTEKDVKELIKKYQIVDEVLDKVEISKEDKKKDNDELVKKIVDSIPKIDKDKIEQDILSKIPKPDNRVDKIVETIKDLPKTLKKLEALEKSHNGLIKKLSFQSTNQSTSYGGEITKLSALVDDVKISSPTNGQALVYDSTLAKWKNGAGGGGSMVYPDAGIAVSTGIAWDTSITNNSANWNTAYGWGNHAGLYLLLDQDTPQTIINGTPIFDEGLEANNSIFVNSGGVIQLLGGGGYLEVVGTDGTNAIMVKSASSNFSQLSLGVNTVAGYSYIQSNKDGSGTALPITFWSQANERMRINQDGTIKLNSYTTNGFVKFTGTNGTLDVDTTTYQAQLNGTGFVKASGTSITYDNSTYLTSVTAHNLLSTTHGDTSADTVVRGDILVGNSTPKWSRLAFPGTPTGKVLIATATDVAWSASALGTAAYAATGDFLALHGKADTAGVADSCTGNAGSVTNGVYTTSQVTVLAAAAAGDYNKYLHANAGTGALEWSTVASAGATTALDNLASVAINTTLVSDTDNTDALGTTAIAWSDLFLGNGAVITWNSAPSTPDVVLTHTSGILTLGTGTLKITTATNTATSVVTIDGTQTLTNKTLTSPNVNEAVALTTTATKLNYLTSATGTAGTATGKVVFDTAPTFVTSITTPSVLATANDSGALGASGTAFSDLFLASGAVINFLAGAVTITHSANTLTLGGSAFTTLALGTTNITMTGSLGVTGSRLTAGFFLDLTVTNKIGGSITGNCDGTAATVTGATQASITTCANLVSIGTITTGVWNGTDIAVADGGTGLGAIADGSILAANTANVLSAVTWHSAGTKVLTNTSGTISWETAGAGAGDVSSASNLTDNAIVRGDGGAKGVQTSGVLIDDSNNVSGILQLKTDHIAENTASHKIVFDNNVDANAKDFTNLGAGTTFKYNGSDTVVRSASPRPAQSTIAATTYYVDDATGNDSTGTGTSAAPFKTIQKAIDLLPEIISHTSTINVSPGTYAESVIVAKLIPTTLIIQSVDLAGRVWNQRGTTIAAGTDATHICIEAAHITGNTDWDGAYIYIYSGTGSGQLRTITSGVASTHILLVPTWDTTPDATSKYQLCGKVKISNGANYAFNAAGSKNIFIYGIGFLTSSTSNWCVFVDGVSGATFLDCAFIAKFCIVVSSMSYCYLGHSCACPSGGGQGICTQAAALCILWYSGAYGASKLADYGAYCNTGSTIAIYEEANFRRCLNGVTVLTGAGVFGPITYSDNTNTGVGRVTDPTWISDIT